MEGTRFMRYTVETTPRFDKEFKKIDQYTKRMIKAWDDALVILTLSVGHR